MKYFLSFLSLLMITTVSKSQNKFDQLDNYLDSVIEYQQAMGTLAVAKNGKIIYERSFGYADVENKIPDNDSTEYRIGSISKSFTSVLVLKSKEQNKLQLDQTINKWFPNIKNANKITLKELLYHRSGIHNFTSDSTYLSWNTKPETQAQLLSKIEKGGSDFTPDSKMEYSNSNYVLLTIILEKVNGNSYKELLRNEIIKPLQLHNTYYGAKINPTNNEAYSYEDNNGKYVKSTETDMSVPLGAGAIVSTPSDLIKFINALFTGKLLTKESLDMMSTPKDKFGMGLFQIPFGNKISWGHTGGIDGFRSVYSYFPQDSISFALCSNGASMNINDISIAALSAANNLPVEMPDFNVKKLVEKELSRYTGTYAGDLPFKIMITSKDGTLVAQAEGQSPATLKYEENDTFSFAAAGATFIFHPDKNTVELHQAGKTFEMKKQ